MEAARQGRTSLGHQQWQVAPDKSLLHGLAAGSGVLSEPSGPPLVVLHHNVVELMGHLDRCLDYQLVGVDDWAGHVVRISDVDLFPAMMQNAREDARGEWWEPKRATWAWVEG